MLRFVKQIVWTAGLIIGCQSAFGFALNGPIPATGAPDNFQVPDIGYALAGDISTPKDLHEEYRRNTPVLYYSFDASFLQYFGTRGADEVDKAFAMFNSLTNVSSYSADLSEFPLDSRRVNFRAAAAGLWDLKSYIMGLMCEQLGFLEPSRWVWALHQRGAHINGFPPCPAGIQYLVYKRNFDYIAGGVDSYDTSSYVNGTLYSYYIFESCSTTPEPEADAVEFPVDSLSSPYSAVADYTSFWYEGLPIGGFYTGFTRDDIGALRYLLSANNLNIESAGARVTEFLTNTVPAVITNQDLGLLVAQSRTNDPATLLALYPGLTITSTNISFGTTVSTNITASLVSSPFDPAGLPPSHLMLSTNYTTNFATFFQYTFGNIVTNTYATRSLAGTISLSLSNSPFATAGTPSTIVTNFTASFLPGIYGDFFILPTNLCGAQILSNAFSQVVGTTNLPTIITPGGTNGTGSTNIISITFIPGNVTFFTNRVLIYLPVTCPVDTVATRQGIERIQFVRRDYDSLINQQWDPLTNDYVLVELTNSAFVPRHMQRRVPRPDFLFSAADLVFNHSFSYSNTVDGATDSETVTTTGNLLADPFAYRTMVFNQNARPANLAGPGTIESPPILPTIFVLNKQAPIFLNGPLGSTNLFLDETTASQLVALGSFDGTTNAPVVYPNGTSIEELEGLLTGPAVTVRMLQNATIGTSYSALLNAQGGQGPYTWTLSPASAGLPAGLNLTSDGQISGTPTGPAAIYDFTVRVTDSLGAFRDVAFTISVF